MCLESLDRRIVPADANQYQSCSTRSLIAVCNSGFALVKAGDAMFDDVSRAVWWSWRTFFWLQHDGRTWMVNTFVDNGVALQSIRKHRMLPTFSLRGPAPRAQGDNPCKRHPMASHASRLLFILGSRHGGRRCQGHFFFLARTNHLSATATLYCLYEDISSV